MNEEEKKVLMDHEYDGIQEFDFSLPRWWLATFWGGVVFCVCYITYFIFMSGPSLKHEYYSEWNEVKAKQTAYLEKLQEFDFDKYKNFRNDESMVLYGKGVFDSSCVACHNHNAAGDIGPNLTDNYWMFMEGSSEEVFQFVITGSPDTGMPAWGAILQQDDLYAVVAYIKSMNGYKHSNPPAKEPQGGEYPVSE